MKIIVIDAIFKSIFEKEIADTGGLVPYQNVIGGYIERGHILKNGDQVTVNSNNSVGLWGWTEHYFILDGVQFGGIGFVSGPQDEKDGKLSSCKSTLEEIESAVKFERIKEEKN